MHSMHTYALPYPALFLVKMTPTFSFFQLKTFFYFLQCTWCFSVLSYPTATMRHLTPYPSAQIILMCSTGGAYKHNAEAISFAGRLQQFGKAQEQHGSFRQAEQAISLFQIQGEFKHNGVVLSGQ